MALNPKDVMLENRLGILKLRGRVQTPPGLSNTALRLGRANCGRQIMGLTISALFQQLQRVLQLRPAGVKTEILMQLVPALGWARIFSADTRGSWPWRQQLCCSASCMKHFHQCQHSLTFSMNAMLALPFPAPGCASIWAFSEPQGMENFHWLLK